MDESKVKASHLDTLSDKQNVTETLIVELNYRLRNVSKFQDTAATSSIGGGVDPATSTHIIDISERQDMINDKLNKMLESLVV